MVSQSKSSISIALCLTAMLMTTPTTQAQLSTIPKRYRSNSDNNKPQELGRKQRQERGQQQQRNKKSLRKLEGDLSMPLQESEFDMSMPSGPRVRMMSMPLQESEFDMSMPTGENPTQTHGGERKVVTLGKGSKSDGKTPLLASFLAGISALAVGAVAIFVKKQQKNDSLVEESRKEREEMEIREGSLFCDASSFAPCDDLGDGEMRDINII